RRRHTIFSRDWSSDVCSSDCTLLNFLLGQDLAGGDVVFVDVNEFEGLRLLIESIEGTRPEQDASFLGNPLGREVFSATLVANRDLVDDAPAPVAGLAARGEDHAKGPSWVVKFSPRTAGAPGVQT